MSRFVLVFGLALAAFNARADHPGLDVGAATAGPIRTVDTATLPRGTAVAGAQTEYLVNKQYSDDQLRGFATQGVAAHSVRAVTTSALGLSYGITDDLTLGLRLPYVQRTNIREAESTTDVHTHGDSTGVGDLTVVAKYRALKGAEDYGAALLFGFKAPTGSTRRIDLDGNRFETDHQPGSGSWDPIVGAAASTRLGSARLHASLLYIIARGGAQQTRLGDRAQVGVALAWRLGGEAHGHGSGAAETHAHDAWDLILEMNGEWEGRQRVAGLVDPAGGGRQIYLSPGVRFVSEARWAAYVSLGIPVAQNPNGAQTRTHGRAIAGLGFAF